jgi:hypothetical protein
VVVVVCYGGGGWRSCINCKQTLVQSEKKYKKIKHTVSRAPSHSSSWRFATVVVVAVVVLTVKKHQYSIKKKKKRKKKHLGLARLEPQLLSPLLLLLA